VVDDSGYARAQIRGAINRRFEGWDIVECASGPEALAASSGDDAKPFDAAIIDYHMPAMNGLVVAAALQKSCPDLLVALCTANVQQKLAEKVEAMGLEFIPKPVDDEHLFTFLNLVDV